MATNKSYKPSSFLAQYIDRFYIFNQSIDDQLILPPILPGTGLELLFHLNEPLSVNGTKLPKGHIVCPRTISYFDQQYKASFISVRFKSGAFRHFTSFPFSQLNNTFLSVSNLWNDKGTDLLNTIDQIKELDRKIRTIEEFLIDSFNHYHNNADDKWDKIIDELYYNFDSNTIQLLSEKANLSLRQFERNFKLQFGMTAKEFQKITRFQDVVKKILLERNPNYLDTILDNGYFDQSHFIKEFKFFTKKTPREYFVKNNFNNHFYHKSIHID